MKQSHRKHYPCPICGGFDEERRHTEKRCWGYTTERAVYCTREEYAGSAPWIEGAKAYRHHLDSAPPKPAPAPRRDVYRVRKPKPLVTLDYGSPDVVYDYGGWEVCRWGTGDEKVIRQRRPNGRGGYHWNLEGVEPHLYHRDELLAAPAGSLVVICEGEKAVETLRERGLLATCSPMGAGKWRDTYAPDLAGMNLVITGDNDEPGRNHANDVAQHTAGIVASAHIVVFDELPEKADVVDYFAAGGTVVGLLERALCTPDRATPVRQDAPAVDGWRADLERDLEQATAALAAEREARKEADHEAERLRKRCAVQGDVITAVARILSSPVTKQEIKAPFARLLIARYTDPRFAEANEKLVPIWQEQFSEMMGGADPKTVRTWLQTIAAENLGTVVKEKTGKIITLPNGAKKPQERYAIQLGPDPDREPVTLTTWRDLMCNPVSDARRQHRKTYERRCSEHPTAFLRRDYHCTECEKLIHQDVVTPSAGETTERSGKVSPPVLSLVGKISPAAIVAVPSTLSAIPRTQRETFPLREATVTDPERALALDMAAAQRELLAEYAYAGGA